MREIISLNKMFKDHFEYVDYEYSSAVDYQDDHDGSMEGFPDATAIVCNHCATGFQAEQDAIIHFNVECGKKLGLKAKSQKNKKK